MRYGGDFVTYEIWGRFEFQGGGRDFRNVLKI